MVEVDRQSQVSQVRSLAGQCLHVRQMIGVMILFLTQYGSRLGLRIGVSFRDTGGAGVKYVLDHEPPVRVITLLQLPPGLCAHLIRR